MLKIENTEVLGWEHAIRGMRNPLNSWAKSDSGSCVSTQAVEEGWFEVGPNDLDLMKRLRNAGTDHRKFMRMITVYVDMIGPLYWWKEFDTYKVGTVANSCSTMHKITSKEFICLPARSIACFRRTSWSILRTATTIRLATIIFLRPMTRRWSLTATSRKRTERWSRLKRPSMRSGRRSG